jgi:hypothetical protein
VLGGGGGGGKTQGWAFPHKPLFPKCRWAEVPQESKYHIYQARFIYNGSSSDTSSADDSGAAALPDGYNLVHHAILYAVMQVRCCCACMHAPSSIAL